MSYNNRSNGYLNNVVNTLRASGDVLRILYNSSVHRAEIEGTSLPIALTRNLRDIYHNGLDALLVPVTISNQRIYCESQYEATLPTEFFMGDRNHGRPMSNKKWRERQKKKKKRKTDRTWMKKHT